MNDDKISIQRLINCAGRLIARRLMYYPGEAEKASNKLEIDAISELIEDLTGPVTLVAVMKESRKWVKQWNGISESLNEPARTTTVPSERQ